MYLFSQTDQHAVASPFFFSASFFSFFSSSAPSCPSSSSSAPSPPSASSSSCRAIVAAVPRPPTLPVWTLDCQSPQKFSIKTSTSTPGPWLLRLPRLRCSWNFYQRIFGTFVPSRVPPALLFSGRCRQDRTSLRLQPKKALQLKKRS
jgi:hypothetical protein